LFLAKVPVALGLTLLLAAISFALLLGSAFVFAGNLPTPSFSLAIQGAGWVALATAIPALAALGLASLLGSRPAAITVLMGWELVLSLQLSQASGLGHARYVLLNTALADLVPGPLGGNLPSISMSVILAVVVLVGWVAVLPVLGAWRTRTRDA
jgi:hypothetical protein